jgi:hypothetical protein
LEKLTIAKIYRINLNYGYSLSDSVIKKIYDDLSTYDTVDMECIIDEFESYSDNKGKVM